MIASLAEALQDLTLILQISLPGRSRGDRLTNSLNCRAVRVSGSPVVRKEALLSSQIEGAQSSFSDLLLYEIE